MAVNLSAPESLSPVSGVRLSTVAAGLRYQGRDDLLIMEFVPGTVSCAVFTKNKFAAAPVIQAKANLAQSAPRALLINAGNANAVTGERGLQNCQRSCALVAELLDLQSSEVLPFSTGVIGEQLSMPALEQGITDACNGLTGSEDNSGAQWENAAGAIMTTDTVAKACSAQLDIAGQTVTITGIAKGSGMICPDMATMLSFVATDALVAKPLLEEMLSRATEASFNRITVDSDTSTNDALVLSATGKAMTAPLASWHSAGAEEFYQALERVLVHLATAIIRDGEGATKFVRVEVINAAQVEDGKAVAYAVAHSPLVKTALFASDPNWGRILMAIGKAETANLDPTVLGVAVNEVDIVAHGEPAVGYSEAAGQAAFAEDEIVIRIDLAQGSERYHVWTSDLSHDYVSINADYRS